MADEQQEPVTDEKRPSSSLSSEAPKGGHLILKPIEEEMRQSYLDYAMSVIIGRALPDARDGLKPVHRRILYAMYDMGMLHNKPFKKSARIVGECFVKDTLVLTTKGLIPIQKIQKGDVVYTQKGAQKVTELYEMPEKELVKITLKNGISHRVTSSQQFKIINKNLEFEWKDAKDLTEEDYLVVRGVYPYIKEYVFLGEFHNKKVSLNENIAYLLGQLLSDGWVEKGYNRGKGFRCGFCSNSMSVITKIVGILKEEFDYDATIEYKEKEIITANGQLFLSKLQTVRIQATVINNFLVDMFNLHTATAFTKIIPEQIFQSPPSVIFSLISGMIDGDGSIHKKRNVIHYGSISERMIDQLQILLQHLGIFSTKYSQDNLKPSLINQRVVQGRTTFYSLEITGRFALALSQQLTIAHEKKLENIHFQKKRLLKISFYDEVPYAGKIIFEELSKYHLGGGWYQASNGKKFRRGIKYSTGMKIRYSKDLKENSLGKTQCITWGIKEKLMLLNSPLSLFLNHIIEDNIYFLKVEKNEQTKAEKTYDIQVEEEHEFIANGVVSHNCLGKYHPHGDTAVYDSLVRMAQNFSLRYPFIDGQGNWGSVDGDSAAAMRYTECRLKKIAEEMLQDIEKETVLFVDNFDGSLKEPSVLPGKLPNLLINGSNGIAVGMATNIPPHNIGEIAQAIILMIDHPETDVTQLMQIVKGPDFPTGGIISGKSGIYSALARGYGKVTVKAKIHMEEKAGRQKIIVDEIPYMVNKAMLIEEIAEYVKNKVIVGIADLRDESDKDGMRIVVDLKKDASSDIVLNQLFKHTRMQTTFAINMLALVNNEPKVLSLRESLTVFIEHRKNVITKRTQYDLTKAEEKAHILEGLIVALNDIDSAIELIKKSTSAEKAREGLMTKYQLTEIQAQAILDMKLQKLTSLEQNKIRDDHTALLLLIKDYKNILATPTRILTLIKTEIQELLEKYNDGRRTEIIDAENEEIEDEALIENTTMVVTITQAGYIKRLPLDTYKQQNRGGKGIIATTTKEEDVVENLFIADNLNTILFFTDKGIVHWLKVYEIPEGTRQAKGKAIVNLLNLEPNTEITAAIPIKQFHENSYLLMATKNGTTKKTSLIAYSKPRAGGIIAITLDEGDHLVNVLLTDGTQEILLATKNGLAVRFHESQCRSIGRSGRGVCGITLKGDDEVIFMVAADPQKTILTITEHGYGKRTTLDEYRLINRGGIGVINIQCSERNGPVVAVAAVTDEDDIMLISQAGITIRIPAKTISVIGRNTQGVRLMRLEDNDVIVACAKIVREESVGIQTPTEQSL